MSVNELQHYETSSHGNFHVFEYSDNYYIFDIEKVNLYKVNQKVYLDINIKGLEHIKTLLNYIQNNEENYHTSKEDRNNPLSSISINVAQVCNLSCVYCYGVDGEYGTKGKMNSQTGEQSIDYLFRESKDIKHVNINFFGGEPLLNFPLIKELVGYSKTEGTKLGKTVSFSMTTNGTLFSTEVNEFLNSHKFSVMVSIDGDAEGQDKNRPYRSGGGSYDKIKPKIKEFLKSRNGNASARATITSHNSNVSEIEKHLKDEFGFRKVNSTVATLSQHAIEHRNVKPISENNHFEILTKIQVDGFELLQMIKNRENLQKIQNSKLFTYLTKIQDKSKSYFPCGVGRTFVGISINGDIFPCHRFVGDENHKLGNINDDHVDRSMYSKSYTKTHPVCSNCWAKYFCGGGGCIQDNEITNGNVKNLNTKFCTNLKMELKVSLHLFSQLTSEDKMYLFNN